INTFCIYYCLEIRMYCLNLMLSLIIAYSFAQMIQNFDKKYIILYIISLTTLFYNFTVTPLIALSYFIVGLIYVLIKKREFWKKFVIIHLIIGGLSSIAIFWMLQSAIAMHHTYTYFPEDNHIFNPFIFYDILENFFTRENMQILADDTHVYRNLFDYITVPQYFIFVVIPIFFGLVGLVRALFSKNSKLYMFLLPSLLFLAILSLLAMTRQASMLTRYLTTIVLIVTCASCYGWAEIKNKIISYTIFALFVYFNLMGVALAENSVYKLHRTESESIANIMAFSVKLRSDDYIINPLSGEKLFYHFRKGKFIPFSVEQAFALKDKESGRFYLGEMFDKLDRSTIKDYLMDDVMKDVPHKYFEDKLYNEYLKDMKKGQRVIFISFWSYYLIPLTQKGYTKESYKSYNMIDFLYSKAMRDCLLVLQKYLHYVTRYEINEGGYSVYVFEKE
ncbi:hypothetical protein IJ670_03145, partial [bacterium]|nr:hypothetical protein [bacterium]